MEGGESTLHLEDEYTWRRWIPNVTRGVDHFLSRLRFRDCNHIVEIVFVEIVFGTYPLSSCLSQTGLRFRDCNHIVEFAFVEFVSALPSKFFHAGLSFTTANWCCCGSALIISLKPQSQVFISLIQKLI
ncbi:hypothetical protein GmHk_16G046402 [Glycine max]|nr:hypothetical protein GmHk_16G046402 [Glycine max]